MHPIWSLLTRPRRAPLRYLSLCSGIEAASEAWHPLGWVPVAFAEVEPFPSAVLAHHWPHVPNLGDMTKWREWDEEMLASADVVVAGCPCQAFSVAGLRNSLDDERGNLTLIYVHILDHIDSLRAARGLPPVIIVYENVPGLLSTKDNAFGCFLGALAGEDEALVPSGKKWSNAGYVRGPQRAIAWRTLDAQYFGVAQRRRRVFLVASAGDRICPAAVLFESEGVRRDTPPRRETGEGTASGFETGPSGGSLTDLAPTMDTRCKDGPIRNQLGVGVIQASWWDGGQVSQTLDAVLSKGQTMPEKNLFPAVLTPIPGVYPTLDASFNRKWGSNQWVNNGFAVLEPVAQVMAVRRLTPVECARLQGFPDFHCRIPWRGKAAEDCPDGPQYKAYGNSFAVPVARWIGTRIANSMNGREEP